MIAMNTFLIVNDLYYLMKTKAQRHMNPWAITFFYIDGGRRH